VYKGATATDKERKQKLYNLFHDGDKNNANSVSLGDHVCEGSSYFTGLYDEVTNDAGVIKRVLKDCLSIDSTSRFVAGKEISRQMLHLATMMKTEFKPWKPCATVKRHQLSCP
jgi:hypothetical protein